MRLVRKNAQIMRSADDLNALNEQVFSPDDTDIFQDDNASIHQAQTVKERLREHETSCSQPQSLDLNPSENLWMCWRDFLPDSPSSQQDVGEKWMQLWTERKVVTLHKLIKMMPQRVCNQSWIWSDHSAVKCTSLSDVIRWVLLNIFRELKSLVDPQVLVSVSFRESYMKLWVCSGVVVKTLCLCLQRRWRAVHLRGRVVWRSVLGVKMSCHKVFHPLCQRSVSLMCIVTCSNFTCV